MEPTFELDIIVLDRDQNKQPKDWARCAFIQPVKANQAANQTNLELGLTEGNRYGSSEPQGTRYGYSEPLLTGNLKPTFRFYPSKMNLNWKGSRQRSAPAVIDQVVDLWSELRAEITGGAEGLAQKTIEKRNKNLHSAVLVANGPYSPVESIYKLFFHWFFRSFKAFGSSIELCLASKRVQARKESVYEAINQRCGGYPIENHERRGERRAQNRLKINDGVRCHLTGKCHVREWVFEWFVHLSEYGCFQERYMDRSRL